MQEFLNKVSSDLAKMYLHGRHIFPGLLHNRLSLSNVGPSANSCDRTTLYISESENDQYSRYVSESPSCHVKGA